MLGFRRYKIQMIVGQDEACEAIARSLQLTYSSLANPNHPRLVILLAGTTGTGKSFTAHCLAQALFGNPDDLVMVDCGALGKSSEHVAGASLLGSPAGYIGHNSTTPLLSPKNINRLRSIKPTRYNSDGEKEELVSEAIIVFDEIEKASDSTCQVMLSLMDTGMVTLGSNQQVDLRCSILILTSNVGSAQAQHFQESGAMGFVDEQKSSDDLIHSEIKRRWSPE